MSDEQEGKRNLQATRLPDLGWSVEATLPSAKVLYRRAEDLALDIISWYLKEKQSSARSSRGLRAVSILLGVLGGLVPLVHAASPSLINAEWGYVLLGAAGGTVALDRLFGWSSSYTRYMASALRLERQLADFQGAWVAQIAKLEGGRPTVVQRDELLREIRDFSDKCLQLVEEETTLWAKDLAEQLAHLDKLASTEGTKRG